jgi:hypothetical protein
LLALSLASGAAMIFLAATLYGVGKTFFWPTTLGVVSEQFPKGGALTLNAMGGVGMLGVGVLGAMLLGNFQDKTIDATLASRDAAIHQQVTVNKRALLGTYHAIDETKVSAADPRARALVKDVQDGSKKIALKQVAVLPVIMLAGYLILLGYFKSRGGYRAVPIGNETRS